ncbi:uncharacterized protein LOC144317254 [Canis aureus]
MRILELRVRCRPLAAARVRRAVAGLFNRHGLFCQVSDSCSSCGCPARPCSVRARVREREVTPSSPEGVEREVRAQGGRRKMVASLKLKDSAFTIQKLGCQSTADLRESRKLTLQRKTLWIWVPEHSAEDLQSL